VFALALVAVVAGSLGAGYLLGSTQPMAARVNTESVTTTTTVTVPSGQFELVFRQIALCPNLGFIAPWKVVLSNSESILANPPNGTSTVCCSASQTNPSTITFFVTNGNYTFSVFPANLLTPANGSVTVNSQDVVVTLGQELFSCGSTTEG